MTKQNLLNLSSFFAHILFFPLLMVTMIDETRNSWIGLSGDLFYDVILWTCLLMSAVMLFAPLDDDARLADAGRVVFMCLFILSLPMLMGLTAYVFLTFIGGGFDALLYLWKLILVLGFLYFYFRVA